MSDYRSSAQKSPDTNRNLVSPFALGIWFLVIMVAANAFAGNDELERRILTALEPAEAIETIDSLQNDGVLTERHALALKARAYNRPGFWSTGGAQTAALFDAALAAFHDGTVLSRRDSVAYYTLLLDYAYFNARASHETPAGSPDGYVEAEEDCLKRVLHNAPLDWQRARAASELGRFYRFRFAPYVPEGGNGYDTASRYLWIVLDGYGGTDFANVALWNLTGLLAEHGRFDQAFMVFERLRNQTVSTKWEERARRLRSTILRREILVDSVASGGQGLMIRGRARNIEGELHLKLDRAREMGFERTGRLPFADEEAAWLTTQTAAIDVAAGRSGEKWQSVIPAPEAGFYRLEVSFDDTTVAYTMGVWDSVFGVVASDSTLAVQPARNARIVMSVYEDDRSWRVIVDRDARAGELVACDLQGRGPFQFYLTDGTQFGWSGPSLWAPSFEVWPNGQHRPAGPEPETG